MSSSDDVLKSLVSHAKEYGFVFPSSEIYDGLSATYDYGPYGVDLKNNIKAYWWKAMVQIHTNLVGLDSAIFMHPTARPASIPGPYDPIYWREEWLKKVVTPLEKNLAVKALL